MITSIRFRTEDGKVILQVCEYTEGSWEYMGSRSKSEWRDALVEDLMNVAAYVRAHDSLTNQINTLQDQVNSMQSVVNCMTQETGRDVRGG